MIRRLPALSLLCACLAACIAAAEPMLSNGGFEKAAADQTDRRKPDGWTLFAHEGAKERISLAARPVRNGESSLRLESSSTSGAYQGLFQAAAVVPGRFYTFSLHVINDPASRLTGTARGQISIEWMDADGKEIERTWGPDFGADLASEKWTRKELTGHTPAGAKTAHFVITLHEGDGPSGGAFLADDAAVEVGP